MELGGATGPNWQVDWPVRNWEWQLCRIGACHSAILRGKLGGAKGQYWQATSEGQGSELGGEFGGSTVQMGRFNGSELAEGTV